MTAKSYHIYYDEIPDLVAQFLRAENLGAQSPLQTYIVHIDQQINDPDSFLATTAAASTDDPQARIVHRYRNVFSGFAAKLSADEVKALEDREGFVSARPERIYELHTTHSPSFLGLNQNAGFWNVSNYGKGVIIGLLDTGIKPDHPSFHDKGMPEPPKKWKGKCKFRSRNACNKKLIGARYFNNGNGTPADGQGHGTHTSSTAGGNFVKKASIFGNANGTAVGIAPLAHVAMYKVCGPNGCPESDIMAGMDAAIRDGVDVLSMSIGGISFPFHSDNIAIGAYRAMEKGIFVSCSAGNKGPSYWTTSNEAPWILTVGASTIDRNLRATVVLGNGEILGGESAFQPRNFSSTRDFKLVFPGKSSNASSFCGKGVLEKADIEGKIVLCENGGSVVRVAKGEAVKNASGAGMILMNQETQGYTLSAEAHVVPASHISYADAVKIKSYMTTVSTPTARLIFQGTRYNYKLAPVVAAFSSRGPSTPSPGILKPDIIGPGNNILAAWPTSLENHQATNSKSTFNIISGTSMSCPHLSGVAALLKSAHPDWSPAAIKSAIMTTADRVNRGGKRIEDQRLVPADVFATGAGHVNPSKANDPGLIYDIKPDDYIPYLCGLKYTNNQVGIIVQRKVDCSKESPIAEAQLNYPSFSINLGSSSQTYTRTVTNVGKSNSTYRVQVISPEKVTVNVNPSKLRFSKVGEKRRYSVRFTRSAAAAKYDSSQGLIKWISAKHLVISPIAVIFE
ncbi:hypothetical protein C2S53_005511 [Perilla frutescens var. hirtella]|uniref:Uncharacterized protein n=1 Tax=Perilla frutescens var. hirtella TaxID=608512 RepID=A0AAD4P9T6_PERFH|nr:hypothetical protein C2S53_005511 [Perilla frutescens var. hirtella]